MSERRRKVEFMRSMALLPPLRLFSLDDFIQQNERMGYSIPRKLIQAIFVVSKQALYLRLAARRLAVAAPVAPSGRALLDLVSLRLPLLHFPNTKPRPGPQLLHFSKSAAGRGDHRVARVKVDRRGGDAELARVSGC